MTATMATAHVLYEPTPDAEVLSDEDVYIGKVRVRTGLPKTAGEGPPTGFRLRRRAGGRGPATPAVQLRDVAQAAVARAMDSAVESSEPRAQALERLSQASGFDGALDKAKSVAEITHFETETGFAVLGASVEEVAIAGAGQADLLARGDAQHPGVVRVHPTRAAHSVVLQFTTGEASVLAALRGYIGHVLVEDRRVMNVSYIPSTNSMRWSDYQGRRERLDQLRAAAAAAVRFGVFRLDEKQAARELAERIRVMKGIDPTLGLYAAYAYSEADRRADIVSVLDCMRSDIEADLFDVRLLARGGIASTDLRDGQVVPFCPLLTQGWNFLRARRVALPTILEDAQDELEPALWTTFKPARARLILDAIKGGWII